MFASRFRAAGLAVAATLGLSACTTYGGLGYGGYGSGVSVGIGNAGYDRYCDPYGYSPYGYRSSRYGYSPYSYGYGYSPYGYGSRYGYAGAGCGGWYDGFYYPGHGYYVYNPYGQRYRWSDEQRRYWERREQERREGRVLNRIDRQVESRQSYNPTTQQDFGTFRQQQVRRVNRDSAGNRGGALNRIQRRVERRQQRSDPD